MSGRDPALHTQRMKDLGNRVEPEIPIGVKNAAERRGRHPRIGSKLPLCLASDLHCLDDDAGYVEPQIEFDAL